MNAEKKRLLDSLVSSMARVSVPTTPAQRSAFARYVSRLDIHRIRQISRSWASISKEGNEA